METILNILFSGVFNASTLFLVAAGLQVVFGVQKVFNLACGSLYALGAYVGIVAVKSFVGGGFPKALFILPLIGAGLLLGVIGPIIERGLIKFVYFSTSFNLCNRDDDRRCHQIHLGNLSSNHRRD